VGPEIHDGPQDAPYRPDNLLDRLTAPARLDLHYRHIAEREQTLLARSLALTQGRVLSVGCGWHPGRHLFPAPQFHLVAVDAEPERVATVAANGAADEAHVGYAGELNFASASFDVVLYSLVLHHIAYQGPLAPCFREARRLLKPGGALVAIEPGLWHPVGAALALANRLGVATAIHGTPDDIPLSPRKLATEARSAGLTPELHAVTYSWRRLPEPVQRAIHHLDTLGSSQQLAKLGHTLLLIARAE
jgi:SAM-dependent methyltransferase